MKKCLCLVAICLFGIMAGCSRNSGNSIQVKGSDTMVNLVQVWAEEFDKENPGENISVTGGGSGTGISAFVNNSCDIVSSSRKMTAEETALAVKNGITPKEYAVALDGIVVVVNPNNPVKKLTLEQLRDIFTGKIKNWKDVDGKDSNIVLLSREINSGTHVFFKEHVLRKGNPKGPEEFASSCLLLPSSQAVADEVSQNSDAIGYYGMGYISKNQKIIAVAKNKGSAYVEPSIETVQKNIYPISRPLFLYTKVDAKESIRKFVDFVFSKTGQEIVKKTDFVPIGTVKK
ncbi:MAG: PstS family phosphate ABC transporter substrate-binding protein [Elusimicrobia bacterium]|nr:PstS family phosphate ABC transporter substrate-binding protein [Elusimicrobiota bacterium]